MPSGSKKRKKNKKDETKPTSPSSQPLPPLPLHQHQDAENGHASAADGHGEEEEELFETPKSQLSDPVDAPHSGSGSSPRVPLDEVPEEEAVVFDEPVKEDSTRFYEAGDENPVVSVETLGDSVSHEDEKPPASRWESTRDEGLVEMVMDESAREDLNVTENHEVLVQEVNNVNVNGEAKEMAQVDDDLNETETSSDRLVEVRVGIAEAADVETVLEKEGSAAESPEVLLEKVDASVSHEKVKIVPLQEEETSSGDGDLDFDADRSEAMRAEGSTEVDTFHVEEAKEIPRIDDGSKETNSDRLAKKKHTPIEIPVSEESLVGGVVTENHEILVDEVDSTSREGKGKELAQSEATAENLNKILVGIVDTTSSPQVSGEHSENAARNESSQRSEVACGPLVVQRATLWNCCGLLDVFTGS